MRKMVCVAFALSLLCTTAAAQGVTKKDSTRTFTSTAGASDFALVMPEGSGGIKFGAEAWEYLRLDGAGDFVTGVSWLRPGAGLWVANAQAAGITGNSPDGATAVALRVTNTNALVTAGAKIAIFSSDNGTTDRLSITKDGAIQLGNAAPAEPTCDAAARGTIYYTPGAAGTKDKVIVCAKDAANVYAWRTIY